MATKKGRAIADYAASKDGCAYIYGGYGEKKCTPAFRKERARAYPKQKNNIYKNCPVLSGKQSSCAGCKWNGKQAYDCAQLTRYACKAGGQELCSGANNQWNKTKWEKKGTIDTLPEAPGVILYHDNGKGTKTHTGVYLGGGYAEEAKQAKDGVVKTAVKKRSWTHWAALPGVLSGAETAPEAPAQKDEQKPAQSAGTAQTGQNNMESGVYNMKTLREGDKGTQVRMLQWRLTDLGYACGTIDGIFGAKTKKAVKEYQKANGLTVDGIVGKNTWAALLK